jgi:hypothetical protein
MFLCFCVIFFTCCSYYAIDGRLEQEYDLLNNKKGSDSTMKHRPMTKEERAYTDEQTLRDLRREACKEINNMDERELQNLIWKLRQRQR